MRKNRYKNFQLVSLPHNSFPYHPYQTSWCKLQANVLTPQGLNMVCGESNEINGEKNCFEFDR